VDIDWHGRFIAVHRNRVYGVATSTKSHQRCRIDMSGQLFAALLEWRRQQRARWLKKGKDVPHTFASLLLQQGESVVYVTEQFGHGSIRVTVDTYGHLIRGANRAAVDRLDDASARKKAEI